MQADWCPVVPTGPRGTMNKEIFVQRGSGERIFFERTDFLFHIAGKS